MSRLLGGAAVCAAVCSGWAVPASGATLEAYDLYGQQLGQVSYLLQPGDTSRATFRNPVDRRTIEVHEWGRASVRTTLGTSAGPRCISTLLVLGLCTSTTDPMRLFVRGQAGDDHFDARALQALAVPGEGLLFDFWLLEQGGRDVVLGSSSDDFVYLGPGADHIIGGGGYDEVDYEREQLPNGGGVTIVLDAPGRGRELTKGDRFDGIEKFAGTPAADSFFGTAGDDGFTGRGGADHALGGDGSDQLQVGAGGVAHGEGGDDTLSRSGAIYGGPGNDTLFAHGTQPITAPVSGGDGDDLVMVNGQAALPPLVSCGDGNDAVHVFGRVGIDPLPVLPADCEQLVDRRS